MAATEAQQQQWQQQFGGPSFPQPALEEIRTLWIGDLLYWMDETYLRNLFAHTGEVMSVKLIRNKLTGYPEGYGFIEFNTHTAADNILQTYNGTQMPQSEQSFRLNWASSGMGDKRVDAGSELSIFVGDLAPDVTDYILHDTFRTRFPSVRGAKVVIDSATGRTKGYGFVRFGDENERARAMVEMNGMYCSSRPMRISAATPKKAQAVTTTTTTTTTLQQPATTPYTGASPAPTTTSALQITAYASPTPPLVAQAFTAADNDPTNTTIFVGGLDPNVGEDELRQTFSQFGELVYVKIPPGKGCGFVQFAQRSNAEDALHRLHGTVIGQQAIRLSWGRSPSAKPVRLSSFFPTVIVSLWLPASDVALGRRHESAAVELLRLPRIRRLWLHSSSRCLCCISRLRSLRPTYGPARRGDLRPAGSCRYRQVERYLHGFQGELVLGKELVAKDLRTPGAVHRKPLNR